MPTGEEGKGGWVVEHRGVESTEEDGADNDCETRPFAVRPGRGRTTDGRRYFLRHGATEVVIVHHGPRARTPSAELVTDLPDL